MSRSLILVAVALFVLTSADPTAEKPKKLAGKRPHGHGHGGFQLPFLRNATAEVKKAFGEILKNQELTVAQADSQIKALAEKNGLAAAFKTHEEKLADASKKTASAVANIASVAAKLSAIRGNKNQTRKAMNEAVAALRKEHPLEVEAIEFIGFKLNSAGRRHGRMGGKDHGRRGGDFKKGPHGKKGEEKKNAN